MKEAEHPEVVEMLRICRESLCWERGWGGGKEEAGRAQALWNRGRGLVTWEWTICAACSGLCGVIGFFIRRRASVENKILEKKNVLSSENLSSTIYLLWQAVLLVWRAVVLPCGCLNFGKLGESRSLVIVVGMDGSSSLPFGNVIEPQFLKNL